MTEDTGLSTDFSPDECQAVAVELNQEGDYFNRTYSVSQTPQFSNPAESIQPVESTQSKTLACCDSEKPVCPPERGSGQHNEDLTSRGCQSLNTEATLKVSEEEADVENEVPVVHSEEDFALEDSRPVASETFSGSSCISGSESSTPEQQTERSVEEETENVHTRNEPS